MPVTKVHQSVGGKATPSSWQYASGSKGNYTDAALVEGVFAPTQWKIGLVLASTTWAKRGDVALVE